MWREVRAWTAYATSKILHAVAAFPPLVTWQQLQTTQAPPKIVFGGGQSGGPSSGRLAGLTIGKDIHNRIEQVQRICINGLGPQTHSVAATDQHGTQQAAPAAEGQQGLLPWGTLDGALQILEGVRHHAEAKSLDVKGDLGQVRPCESNLHQNHCYFRVSFRVKEWTPR